MPPLVRRNVLIFHLGALGDFVLSWPLALALGRIYAQSRLIYITHSQKGELADRILRLESNDIENGWHELFSAEPKLTAANEKLLQSAAVIFTFLGDHPNWMKNVQRFAPDARVVSVQCRPPADFKSHASEWLLTELKNHPVEHAATEAMLKSIADRGVSYKSNISADVVIHPGSGGVDKCWPAERFAELATKLKGRRCRFLLGEAEREWWEAKKFDLLKSTGEIIYPAKLIDLANQIAGARLFIGNDSGPGHLAGVLGVPTVSLFGATNAEVWKPMGPRVNAVAAGDINSISVDQVLDELKRRGL